MTELDTSAYTPAHETENEEEEEEEQHRSRFQIPLDTAQEENLEKTLKTLEQQVRQGTEFYNKVQELKNLLDNYDSRKHLKMFVYKCDKCNETFDTKKGIGVHHTMNPNCNDNERPWNAEPPTHTKIRVEDL